MPRLATGAQQTQARSTGKVRVWHCAGNPPAHPARETPDDRLSSNRRRRPALAGFARAPRNAASPDSARLRHRARGRPRKPAARTHRLACQAGGAVRRQAEDHRLRAQQLRQLGHPPHRRADAVQGAEPDPARGTRLGFPGSQPGRIRRRRARAATAGRQLVQRHRQRGVPEPRHPARGESGVRAGARRRPHLQDGLRAHAGRACGARRRPHAGLHRSAVARGVQLRRHERRCRCARDRFRREAGSPNTLPRRARARAREHGHLCVQQVLPVRAPRARRRRSRVQP